MVFGTDEFFNKLNTEVRDPAAYPCMYDDLYAVVGKDLNYRILKSVNYNENDAEDILQMVCMEVFRQLPRFLANSAGMRENQRDAWLNRIVDGKISDYIRKNRDFNVDSNEDPDRDIDRYEALQRSTLQGDPAAIVSDRVVDGILMKRLEHLFSLNANPKRIMVFCYSKIIIPMEEGDFTNNASGKPKHTYKRLNNMPLICVFHFMQRDLSLVIEKDIPEYVFRVLEQKIYDKEHKCRRFELEERMIRDASTRIQSKN